MEQRIEELKNDLAAYDFCLWQFFATGAVFLAVVAAFNLLSLFQVASASQKYRQPATLCGRMCFCVLLVLGRRRRKPLLYLSLSWGGLESHKFLLEVILRWAKPTVEKLDSVHPN